ncbi:MAG: VWA domain-containing protein [Deltaproteobacteria bacterium]|nr:VWA domain-containing protein [Deltaproteobacteria bacterium]
MRFESPWVFLLLAIIPLLIWMKYGRAVKGTLIFSSVADVKKAGLSVRQAFSGLPGMLRVFALVCLIIALARPQTGMEQVREISKGIAIEMVIDRSGSMGAEMKYGGNAMNRLDVVKQVFSDFVLGDGNELEGRKDDLVGMIAFARYPDTICPLTLAHGAFPAFMESIKLVRTRDEDGTAIGDAIALAAARLKKVDETIARQRKKGENPYHIKSRVIILLSDGENNYGRRSPLEAAEIASEWGIKVYAIAIGGGEAVTSIKTPFGVYKMPVGPRVDTSELKAVAEKTGGFFRQAQNAEALREIYREIDGMERTEIESVRFVDYKEVFHWPLLAGLFLIGLEIILTSTLFRKIP